VEHLQQSGAITHDLLEFVLRAQFLPEINILLLQPCLQAGNLLVGLHILNRQCDLVRHFLQKKGILIGYRYLCWLTMLSSPIHFS
jgi:hypothetical protein